MRSRQACCCAQFAASESPPLPGLGVDTLGFNSFVYSLRFRKPSWDILLGVVKQAFPLSLIVYTVRALNVTLLLRHVFCYGCKLDDRFISQINNLACGTGLSTAVSCTLNWASTVAHFKRGYRLRRKRPRYVTRRACALVCIIENVNTWAFWNAKKQVCDACWFVLPCKKWAPGSRSRAKR